MSEITDMLDAPRSMFGSVPIDEFSTYIDEYRKYRAYVDNTTALFEEVGLEIPKKDEYDNNTCINYIVL